MYIGKNGSSVSTSAGRITAYVSMSSNGYPSLCIQLKTKNHSVNLLQIEYDEDEQEFSIKMLSNRTWKMMKIISYKKDDLVF